MKPVAYKDGNDFVIVFENCTQEMRKKLVDEFSPDIIGDAEVEQIVTPELKFTEGKYQGFTPDDALARDGQDAYVFLYKNLKNDEMFSSTEAALKRFVKDQYKGDPYELVSGWSEKRCNAFFKWCGIWFTPEIRKKMLNGFADFEAFCSTALPTQKKAAIAAVIDNIQKEVT